MQLCVIMYELYFNFHFHKVQVISARNLPEMKKLSHTADAYVELHLISDSNMHSVEKNSEVARTSVQVDYIQKKLFLFCKILNLEDC